MLKIHLVFTLFLSSACSVNILGIFELPSKSLHILGVELLAGLAKRGYNVTLVSAYPLEKQIANFSHVHIEELIKFKEDVISPLLEEPSKVKVLLTGLNLQVKMVDIVMQSKGIKNLLKSNVNYDVIIQTYVLNEGYLGLAHHFNARVIGFVPFSSIPNVISLTGNSAPPSYVPIPFVGFTEDLYFSDRLINTLAVNCMTLFNQFYSRPLQGEIIKKYFPEAPPLDELENERVDLIFINAHFSNESPRPKTPNIIYIGGYHVQEPEPLTPNLQNYMDSAEEGVVFLGFGTNVEMMKLPKEKMDAFVRKFAKIPYKVLFKYDGVLENKPSNVKTVAWVPQRGILAHPNTKIFISHGGRGSTLESLYSGVPILCVSFFGDQHKNCKDIVGDGYGVHLPFEEVTEETFEKAFDELVGDIKYAQSVKYKSSLFKEQEMDPLDRACFWIEHILKFNGAKHLWPKSARMPLYQYLLLDVWIFIVLAFSLSVFVLIKVLKLVLKLCKKNQESKKKLKIKKS